MDRNDQLWYGYLYSAASFGSGKLLRKNGADSEDYFDSDALPRVAVNPVNGRVYVVYGDLPSAGSNTDRGEIFVQEGIATGDGSLTWSGSIKVNNDRTTTDQWNPSVTVSSAGDWLFVGCYSRQFDTTNNAWIKAYGAKAYVPNGLAGATFDVFPIDSVSFTNLFPGTTNSTPAEYPLALR